MGTSYEVWLCNDSGRRLTLLSDIMKSLNYVKTTGKIGWVSVVVSGLLPSNFLKPDNQIQVWRSVDGSIPNLETIGFLRRWIPTTQGTITTTDISGPDPNTILSRRIVKYVAGSTEAQGNGAADDLMKAVVRENMGSSAPANRDWTSNGFSVDPDLGNGPTISKSFAWRNVQEVLTDLSAMSRAAGNEVFFDVVVNGISKNNVPSFVFRTRTGQPNIDRTQGIGGKSVTFGTNLGNLRDPRLIMDYSTEFSHITTGGQGEESERDIQESENTVRTGASIWGRIEGFLNSTQTPKDDLTKLQDESDSFLVANGAKSFFSGVLVDSNQARYGKDWFFGDKVTAAAFEGVEFDGIIRSISVTVSKFAGEFNETINATIESELVL